MPAPTILVVEDDANQRELYRQELEDAGYKVVMASDGKQAVEIVNNQHIDLVVLDINMPVMDGIEALGRMLSRNNQLPVIIHTAYAHYKDNFMTWVAEHYVIKSSDLTELKDKVAEVLRSRGVL